MSLTKISTNGVKDDAITRSQIVNGAINGSKCENESIGAEKLTAGTINNADISASAAISISKLELGTSSNNGKFLRANNGSAPSYETIPAAAISAIGSTGANRVITDDGDGTVTAEANLTFDGTELKIGGDSGVAGTWGLEIYQTANNQGTLLLAGLAGAELKLQDTVSGETIRIAANGQASFYSQKENDPMVFFTKPTGGSDTERLRLNGNGEIGLLTSTPNLTGFSSPTVSIGKSANPYSVLEMQGNNSSDGAFGVIAGYNSAGSARTNQFVMAKQGANNSGAFVFELASAGSLGERVRITNDGLTFGGNTATANALDAYEEGSWSPGGSWTTIDAHYIKIGRIVIAGFSLRANTTGSADAQITNLPFQAANNKGSQGGIAWGLCEYNSTGGWIHGFVDENTTNGILKKNGGNNLTFGSGNNNMNNQAFIRGTFIYLALS